jgi:error-prone DNA polymerase
VRSGRRVVFLTLDDATGPVDATFFEDAQGPYAATVFGSWLLLVRGHVRRTGPRGISLRATGAWELGVVHDRWRRGGTAAVAALLDADTGTHGDGDEAAGRGRAASRSSRPVVAAAPAAAAGTEDQLRRVLVHASGFRQSPYADIVPQGVPAADTRSQVAAAGSTGAPEQEPEVPEDTTGRSAPPSKLWHASPGSSGW